MVTNRTAINWDAIVEQKTGIAATPAASPVNECKFCNSRSIIRYGTYKGAQRWICRACGRKFAGNHAPAGMRTPSVQIASAINMFYEGLSIRDIRRRLANSYGAKPSDSTINGWIIKYTGLALDALKGYIPRVGGTWLVEETMLKIEGSNTWFLDIIDESTHFLLATRLSPRKTNKVARMVLESAANLAGKMPEKIVTGKFAGSADRKITALVVTAKGNTATDARMVIDAMHQLDNIMGPRTDIVRGLKKMETVKLVSRGWFIHYNFLRPDRGLHNLTPAEIAGIECNRRNWLDIVRGT